MSVLEIEIDIFGRNNIKIKSLISYEKVSDGRIFIGNLQRDFEIMHIFHEVCTDPHTNYNRESVFLCDFWYTVHAMKRRIGPYTSKSSRYESEILIDSFWSDEIFIFIETVFRPIWTIADAIKLFRRGFDCVRSIEITPPADICEEKCRKENILDDSFFEHRRGV